MIMIADSSIDNANRDSGTKGHSGNQRCFPYSHNIILLIRLVKGI